jgi:NlpC/P60 family putative phage cell wall peptidase
VNAQADALQKQVVRPNEVPPSRRSAPATATNTQPRQVWGFFMGAFMNHGTAIVAEARRWIGTPYHHQADIMGLGVDCAMILVRIFCDLGLVPPFDPRPYSTDWHLHRSEERYLGDVLRYAAKVDDPQPGDIALFKFGRCLSHSGIIESITPEIIMIHANMKAGYVERAEVRQFSERLAGYWRVTA